MKNSVIEFLYDAVSRYPEKVGVADEHDELIYRDFFRMAYNLAKVLRSENVTNQPVLVCLPKTAHAIVSFAGVLMSGNFYVPVDLKSPSERLKKIVESLSPCRVVSMRKFEDQLQTMTPEKEKFVFLDDFCSEDTNLSIEEMISDARNLTDTIIDADPCYVMFTSGSTGVPKGVVVPHRGVIDYIEWALSCLKAERDDVIGNQAPLHFDNSTLDIYLSWATGASLHLIPDKVFAFPVKLLEYLEKKEITFVFFVPSVLVSIAQMNLLSPERLPRLKKIVFAGEVMPTKHLASWQETLPDRMYVNLYGPTEITVDCTYFIVDRIYEPHESLPIGYPCHNSGVFILNEDNRAARAGEQGELCVRGSSLALGYWNDEERTKEVFVQNPLQKNYYDRIYRTGDFVYQNEKGQIIFVGRKDSQIKHMGYRIELGEIELAAGAVSQVGKCCVLYDREKREIVLFYEGAREISAGEFRKALADRVPGYMIPRRFHYLERLPINPNGKIDRTALRGEFMSGSD